MNEQVCTSSDLTLVNNIKNGVDVDQSIDALASRHSGLYRQVVRGTYPESGTYISVNDQLESKKLRVWQSALKYEADKGASFLTFFGNFTRWMCLKDLGKTRKHHEIRLCDGQELDDFQIEQSSETLENVTDLVRKEINSIPNQQIRDIMLLRYFSKESKAPSWKKVSKQTGVSVSNCMSLHRKALKLLRNRLLAAHGKEISTWLQ